MSTEERFHAKVNKTAECWLWTGAKGADGYGLFESPRLVRAHRFAWTLANGAIPDGLYVCHRCDNPLCVRPDHLFLGTAAENASDMARKKRARSPLAERNRMVTHCPQGHEYTPENTYARAEGRKCKTCVQARARAYYRRNHPVGSRRSYRHNTPIGG